MTKLINLKSIDRRFPWSFLGFLAGVIFGLFGVYTVFFYAKAPELKAEIQSATPVFSLKENVHDLNIIFKGQDIKQAHKGLTLINLKLINNGNFSIKPGDFDPKAPLTIILKKGEIVKADILETSDPYFKKVFADTKISSQSIQFPPFIMDPGQYLSIHLLTLHEESARPTLTITGKIANVPNVPVIKIVSNPSNTSKQTLAFSGDIIVQFMRVLVYGISTLLGIIGIIILFWKIQSSIESKRRKNHRLKIEMEIEKFLLSLPREDRLALEPIAKAILRNKELREALFRKLPRIREFWDYYDDLKRHLSDEGLNEELNEKLNEKLNYYFEDLKIISPNFNFDRIISNEKRLMALVQLLTILDSYF